MKNDFLIIVTVLQQDVFVEFGQKHKQNHCLLVKSENALRVAWRGAHVTALSISVCTYLDLVGCHFTCGLTIF